MRWAILYGYLALGIRAKVGHHLPFTADNGQLHQQAVSQVEAERHVVVCLVGGIAKHHTLVAGALILRICTLNASVDVGTLLVDGTQDTAAVAFEHILALGIANAVDHFAGNTLKVNVCLGLYFTCHNHLSCSDKGLAGYLRLWVESQQFVQYGIADLVGHFIRMAFRN